MFHVKRNFYVLTLDFMKLEQLEQFIKEKQKENIFILTLLRS